MIGAGAEFQIVWSPSAQRSLNRLPEKVTLAVVEFVHGPLASNPYRLGKPLSLALAGVHGARRGDYRVLYRIDDRERTVEIALVEHRSHVYRSRGPQ